MKFALLMGLTSGLNSVSASVTYHPKANFSYISTFFNSVKFCLI